MQQSEKKSVITHMNETLTGPFSRTALLMGDQAMQRLAAARVLLFGTGGVGSWCAEALIRSGVGHLTMVDPDEVDVSNINRQLPATAATVGRPKVEVLRERLLSINPAADITARQERFTAESAASFHLEAFDYVIDAIDSMADKMELILLCTQKPLTSHLLQFDGCRPQDGPYTGEGQRVLEGRRLSAGGYAAQAHAARIAFPGT